MWNAFFENRGNSGMLDYSMEGVQEEKQVDDIMGKWKNSRGEGNQELGRERDLMSTSG